MAVGIIPEKETQSREAGLRYSAREDPAPCLSPAAPKPSMPDILEVNMDKRDDAIRVFITDPVLQKRLAKYLVQRCFRNSVLEDLHAGIAPDSKAGDYSDVVVSTPFGEIPWAKFSRFDDKEMKTLMIDVVQKTYEFIQELFDVESGGELLLRLAARDPVPQWQDPR